MSSSSASKAKKFILRNVIDGFRGTGTSQNRQDNEIEETLRSEHFHAVKTVRHGFPFQPTALAYDSVQHLLAVGNRTGSLRIRYQLQIEKDDFLNFPEHISQIALSVKIGQPGVDCFCSHDAEVSITQILFLINEGALVTVTNDDHLHLWNFRQKQPCIVHSLKFQREKISKCHLPFRSKWLYVGTERGNVHIVSIESFTCSGYIINWNKAIELSRKTHPGPVIHLSDNPVDPNKLLIGFESGAIVFWDLKTKSAEYRYNSQEALRSVSWHHEGKQFMCSHSDGSLSTWSVRTPQRPISVISPHAKIGPDGRWEVCKPIPKVEWKSTRNGEAIIIFSGGMPYDRAGRTPCVTVMAGKNTTVLEMEHNIVDFVSLSDTPWVNDFQDPHAIVVLLQNDLVVIDLNTPGYPCFENPYQMDLHESSVTTCQYYANCPMDIIPALYSTGKNQKKTGFSEKPWPIKGGTWGASGNSYPEIIITGHADGSLKFWDASSVSLQFLYKLKTAKVFEKSKKLSEDKDDDPFAIQSIFLCLESRILCVAGPTHCVVFRFSKQETSVEIVSLEFSIVYEVSDELDSPDFEFSKPSLSMLGRHNNSTGSHSSTASDSAKSESVTSVKARGGSHRWGPGFLPDLVCILCWVNGEPLGNITVMSLNSSYGLLAFGNESGLAIVDYLQKTCLLNMGTPDLYGSMDPYQRATRSPRSKKASGEGLAQGSEDSKSPTVDQQQKDFQETYIPLDRSASLEVSENASSLSPIWLNEPQKYSFHLGPKVSQSSPEKYQGALILFEGDSLKAKSEPVKQQSLSVVPKPPPRNKRRRKQQNALVHQPALDLPPSPKEEYSKSPPKESVILSPSCYGQLELRSALSTVLAPAITLPRSASDMGQTGGFGHSSCLSENPAHLSPSSNMKPKSASTGDIPADETMDNGISASALEIEKEVAGKTDPEGITEEIDKIEGLKKSSSDSQIPMTDNVLALKLINQSTEPHNKNWLFRKMQKMSDKKRQSRGEELKICGKNISCDTEVEQADAGGRNTLMNSARDGEENLSVFESEQLNIGDRYDGDLSECTEIGLREAKSPESNRTFFGQVGLKIKSFGCLKYSNEDEDRDAAFAPPQKSHRKSQPKVKIEVLDLTDDAAHTHSIRKMYLSEVMQTRKATDKADGLSFSRSRSSSISSLDNVSKEAVQSLVFADSYAHKQDNETSPCLWVGTSLGSVIVIVLILHPEQRLSQPVIVSPSGSLYRMKGSIICMSFLDFKGSLIHSVSEQWKDNRDNRDCNERVVSKTTSRQMSLSNSKSKISPPSSAEVNNDKQFAILCSEKQARAILLPSQICAFKVKVTETSSVVKAEIVSLRESVCLMCYVANGHILAFSLPSLKPLFDADFLPVADCRAAKTFCFSNSGHAMFLCSPTEIQKITYSADIFENLSDMIGDLFLPKDTPEAPKQSFLKSLFGGGVAALDREELFGEASGKASKSLTKHIPGTGNISYLQQQAGASGSEFSRTRLLISERGEKLGEIEDRSAQLMNTAEQFASAAHNVMLKYKDKKWYHL